MAIKKTKIGIIGCGNISGIYFENAAKLEILEVAACADLIPERAQQVAEKYNIPRALAVNDLLADPEIEIVLNLTIPTAHFDIAMAAIEAGKNVYNEKPLAITCRQGDEILKAADAKGVLVGCAPDTFMGAGMQTCRKIIDDGLIGRPIAATAFMTSHGVESWHPNPEFFYKPGAGPMLDMGPYYLTALINLIGPVNRVTGSAKITSPTRTITSQPHHGKVITVEVPTHIAGVLDFVSGAVGTIITSFDIWAANLPCIEIYGTHGSLSVPDPNTFGGPIKIFQPGSDASWQDVEPTHPYAENSRGLGVADMAYALRSGRPHRANSLLANHVLEVMHAFGKASRKDRHIQLKTTCKQPKPLPTNLPKNTLDE